MEATCQNRCPGPEPNQALLWAQSQPSFGHVGLGGFWPKGQARKSLPIPEPPEQLLVNGTGLPTETHAIH